MIEVNNEVQEAKGDLAVSEIFGPTFQGEGSSIGRRCYFLRLAGCNQHCVWCDTPYTWDWTGRNGTKYDPKQEVKKYSVADILDVLGSLGAKSSGEMLVISGGEPMLQQEKLYPLIQDLHYEGWRVEVETAGTIAPTLSFLAMVDQLNISPKLENSGNDKKTRYRPDVLRLLQRHPFVCWKFVATQETDLDEIQEIVDECGLDPVYIMPEGINDKVIHLRMQALSESVLKRGWNLTTRLQVELWGNTRGV